MPQGCLFNQGLLRRPTRDTFGDIKQSFPDKANDYVIRVDERDAVVVKEFRTEPTKEEIMVIAQNIF